MTDDEEEIADVPDRRDGEPKEDWRGRAMFEQSNWLTWVMEQEEDEEDD